MKRLLLLGAIWGWSFVFIKVAVEGIPPTAVAFARIALGAAVLAVVARRRGRHLPRDLATWGHLTMVATVGSAVPFTLLAWGEERITSALTSVLNASTPLFTALAAAVIVPDRLRAVHGAGLALGLAGVAVAAGLGADDLTGSSLAGAGAAVGAGACYGVAFAWTRRHLVGVPPLVAAWGQLVAGAVVLVPFAVPASVAEGLRLSPTRVVSVVLLGAVGTGLAYVLNYANVRDLGATRASLVTYIVPAVAVVVGIVVLDEPFRIGLVLGGVLIVAGIALATDRVPRRRLPPVAPAAPVLVLVALVAALAGCGGDDRGASGDCGPIRREALDSASLVHVLGDTDHDYSSDPPTSGPHQPGPPISGVVDQPLTRPVQVGILERGDVLVQYRPGDVDDAGRRRLAELAGEGVVVAPNDDLPDVVVATAWVFSRACGSVDVAPLEEFIAERRGKGPDQ